MILKSRKTERQAVRSISLVPTVGRIKIAAAGSSEAADLYCDGIHDQEIIQMAIDRLSARFDIVIIDLGEGIFRINK